MPIAKKFCISPRRSHREITRVSIGPEMLARKKLGTKDEPVSRPSPLSDDMKIAFHSASFGTTASASDDRTMPNSRWQSSRSTTSCALRTQVAGSPVVSSTRNSICRPSSPPLAFTCLAQNSAPWRICWPISAAGPVRASGMPMRIGVSPRAWRSTVGAATAASPTRITVRRVNGVAMALAMLSSRFIETVSARSQTRFKPRAPLPRLRRLIWVNARAGYTA